ncbi:MAG: HlyD family type I secretion periplasmic adaptor subunit [Kiloniellales bacterium]
MVDFASRMSPNQLRVDMLRGPRIAAILLLVVLVAMLIAAVIWAQQAELDEVTRGMGQVIPSSEVQVVQNLEGGIVSEIMVKSGATVEAGQVLLRIDDTSAAAGFKELRETYFGLLASVARLTAEVEGKELVFPEDVQRERPDLVASEQQLFLTRRSELDSAIRILEEQRTQRIGEVEELRSRLSGLKRSLALVNEEYQLTAPLLAKGMVSRVDVIRLERERADLSTEIRHIELSIPNAQAAISEAEQRIQERRNNAKGQALAELNDKKVKLASLVEQMRAREDRVVRTEVRSPMRGIVKKVKLTTVGGVVQPGQELIEIVPLEDTLLVEARISPSDVAFLHPGQAVRIKLTAYDFSIYGGLDGELEQISADTIEDERGEHYYHVRARTQETHLTGRDGEPLPIIPGMVAEVDVLTGKKTVLQYLMKPFIKARHNAFRER